MLARSPFGIALDQFRPRECEDEDRVVPRPLEEVFHEVEQRRIGPLHVVEGEDYRLLLRHPLEESSPAGEHVLALMHLPLLEPQQLSGRGSTQSAPRRRDNGFHALAELRPRRLRVVTLGDPGTHSHHLSERPVCDAFAVRKAASPVPQDDVRQPVDVLVELPRE